MHNFAALLLKPGKGKEARLRDFLNKRYKHLFQDESDMRGEDYDA